MIFLQITITKWDWLNKTEVLKDSITIWEVLTKSSKLIGTNLVFQFAIWNTIMLTNELFQHPTPSAVNKSWCKSRKCKHLNHGRKQQQSTENYVWLFNRTSHEGVRIKNKYPRVQRCVPKFAEIAIKIVKERSWKKDWRKDCLGKVVKKKIVKEILWR